MSQMTAATTLAPKAPRRATRAPLEVVSPRRAERTVIFPVLCLALLLAGLGAVLALNTAMAQDSFEVTRLEARSAALSDTQDTLTHEVDAVSAPARLADQARRLGMVPADSAAFIDLDKAAVLGVASAAKKPAGFTVDAAASATPTSSPSASADSSPEAGTTAGSGQSSAAAR